MRPHSLGGLVVLGALLASVVPATARADAADDAKALFEQGRDLRARGNCADALPFFQKAYAAYPLGLGSLRNIAVCREAMGRFASSRDAWVELKRSVAGSKDSKYAGWTDDADRALARLAPKVSKLTIDLAAVYPNGEPAPDDGVDVTLDGQPLARERLGAAVNHDPGIYVVRAAGRGTDAPEQSVELGAGDSKHVTLRVTVKSALTASNADGTEGASEGGTGAPAGSGSSGVRTGAWIAVGVGAAGVAGAAVSLILRQSALSDLNATCPNTTICPGDPDRRAAVLSDMHRGQTASTLFTVFGAVGIVGTVVGVTLLTTSHAPSSPAAPATQSALVLTPSGLAATGTF